MKKHRYSVTATGASAIIFHSACLDVRAVTATINNSLSLHWQPTAVAELLITTPPWQIQMTEGAIKAALHRYRPGYWLMRQVKWAHEDIASPSATPCVPRGESANCYTPWATYFSVKARILRSKTRLREQSAHMKRKRKNTTATNDICTQKRREFAKVEAETRLTCVKVVFRKQKQTCRKLEQRGLCEVGQQRNENGTKSGQCLPRAGFH